MLPVNPSQTMTSARPLKNSRASRLPRKSIGARLEQGVRFANQIVALAGLFADRQQADFRLVDVKEDARVRGAQHAELTEVVGAAVEVGAGIEQDRRARHGSER